MLRHKNCATVLKGLNGCLIASDLPGYCDNFLLIEADQRAEHRKTAYRIGADQAVHRLAGHLADALSGNQCLCAVLLRKNLRNFHHISPHDNGKLLMRTFFVNSQLDIREINNMKPDRTAVGRHNPRQIHDLLLCPLAGIRRGMEVDRIYGHSPLGNHITGDRRIDSSRKKELCLPVCPYRHASRSGNYMGIDIDLLPHLHGDHAVRMMDIHLHPGASVQNRLPQIRVQLHGIPGVAFVGAARKNLKGLCPALRINLCRVADYSLSQSLEALVLHNHDRTDSGNAEHMAHGIYGSLEIEAAVCPDINSSHFTGNFKFSIHRLQTAGNLADQCLLKKNSVFSFDADFSIFNQKRLIIHPIPHSFLPVRFLLHVCMPPKTGQCLVKRRSMGSSSRSASSV